MRRRFATCIAAVPLIFAMSACTKKEPIDESAAAPPQAKVDVVPDLNVVKVQNPDRFKLVSTGRIKSVNEITATGVVNPDVELSVPVVSLASGRVVEVDAKLGDSVRKGQLLLKVLSNDIATGFQNYKQAQADEVLAQKQLERAQLLYEHGAISLNDLQVAQDIEQKAKVAVETAAQSLRTLGADPNHDSSIVNINAPIGGVITEQNVVQSASVHTPDNQPNLFTISNLSVVWVICDVYENDLPNVKLGDTADVRLNAYPDRALHGRISNIGEVLDPTIRTAKVRIQLTNPGIIRSGMFVTATFYGLHGHEHATAPAGSILHLHDRDWVFVPAGSNQFRRTEVSLGKTSDGEVEILSGVQPNQSVVANALALSAETEQ